MKTAKDVFESIIRSDALQVADLTPDLQENIVQQLRSYGMLVGQTKPGLLQCFRRQEPFWIALTPEHEAEAKALNDAYALY